MTTDQEQARQTALRTLSRRELEALCDSLIEQLDAEQAQRLAIERELLAELARL